jgi:flagella basal body P-ring formation protein FlgA
MSLLLLLIVAQNTQAVDAVRASLPPRLGLVELQSPVKLDGEVVAEWPAAPHPGTQSVRLVGRRHAHWAQVKLGLLQRVLVAKVDLARDQPIAGSEVALEERPAAGWQADPAALQGAHPRRDLRAGELIQANDLILPPPLPRGLEMRVVLRRPGLVVTTTAILEKPARRGEKTVARLQQRLVSARVVDDNTLEIQP